MTSTRTLRSFPSALALLPALASFAVLLAAATLAVTVAGCATPLEGMEKEVRPTDLEALKAVGEQGQRPRRLDQLARRAPAPLYTMKTDGSETRQLTKGNVDRLAPCASLPTAARSSSSRSQDSGFVRESDANIPENVGPLYDRHRRHRAHERSSRTARGAAGRAPTRSSSCAARGSCARSWAPRPSRMTSRRSWTRAVTRSSTA